MRWVILYHGMWGNVHAERPAAFLLSRMAPASLTTAEGISARAMARPTEFHISALKHVTGPVRRGRETRVCVCTVCGAALLKRSSWPRVRVAWIHSPLSHWLHSSPPACRPVGPTSIRQLLHIGPHLSRCSCSNPLLIVRNDDAKVGTFSDHALLYSRPGAPGLLPSKALGFTPLTSPGRGLASAQSAALQGAAAFSAVRERPPEIDNGPDTPARCPPIPALRWMSIRSKGAAGISKLVDHQRRTSGLPRRHRRRPSLRAALKTPGSRSYRPITSLPTLRFNMVRPSSPRDHSFAR
jgi:hypothetical protein